LGANFDTALQIYYGNGVTGAQANATLIIILKERGNKMQLKKSSFIIFIFILSTACSAQTSTTSDSTVKINDWHKIHNAILSSINEHEDSLRFSGIGTVFFRMKLRNGHFTDIKCSAKEPSLLISLVTDALKTQEIKMENFHSPNSDFILPVNFIFHLISEANNVEQLLKLVPKIDVKELLSKPTVDPFKQLFDISDNSSSVYGVQCIFLPWITLRGPFH
jgi:hypothetical protein